MMSQQKESMDPVTEVDAMDKADLLLLRGTHPKAQCSKLIIHRLHHRTMITGDADPIEAIAATATISMAATISRTLSRMTIAGIVLVLTRTITILDVEATTRMVHGRMAVLATTEMTILVMVLATTRTIVSRGHTRVVGNMAHWISSHARALLHL